jgi:membrane protease YdiL (CAAX protease family)
MRWKIIIRDAVLIFILWWSGGTVVGEATGRLSSARGFGDLAPETLLGAGTLAFLAIGFTISGLLARRDRTRHLFMVALLVWTLSIYAIFFSGFLFLTVWLIDGALIVFASVVGWGVADLLTRSGARIDPEGAAPSPWGPWASTAIAMLGWAAAALVTLACASVLLERGIADQNLMHYVWGDREAPVTQTARLLDVLNTLVILAVVLWFIHMRRGFSVYEYLALHRARPLTFAKWLIAIAALDASGLLIWSALPPELQGALVADTVVEFSFPLFALATISVVPIAEELIFRGFLFAGFQNSKLGNWGAVIGTTILFALVHADSTKILAIGLLLGLARLRTRSLYVPIAMHALSNCIIWIAAENLYR